MAAGPAMRGGFTTGQRSTVISWRAITIGLLLIPVQTWWVVEMEVISQNTWPTMLSLPLHSLFILLLLVAFNQFLTRRHSRWVLSQQELLIVYIMLAIAGSISGYGGLQSMVGWVIVPAARATIENRWEAIFGQYLPTWLVFTDREAVQALLDGQSSLFTGPHLRLWAMPMLNWGGFYLAFFFAMLSLSTLLRRRWIDEERLTFPLVQVPLAVTGGGESLFRNRLLWIAFAISFGAGLVNGLHVLLPAAPSLQPDLSGINESLRLRWPPLGFSGGVIFPPLAWAVGVGFLMPLDVAFSYWFFYWFIKLQQIITVAGGWDVAPEAPFVRSQAAGALLTLGMFSFWSGRHHLSHALRKALRPSSAQNDEQEPMPYRWALGLLVLSIGTMVAFLWRAGAPVSLVVVYLWLYLTATIAIARLRAELGAPANELHIAPQHIITQLVSPAAIPLRALTVLTVFAWTSRSFGTDPTPFQIEGFKLAERTRLNPRALPWAMVIATAAGLLVGYVALLSPLYRLGIDSSKMQYDMGHASTAFTELQGWATVVPHGAGYHGLAMGASVLLTISLFVMRARFLWWPLHPVGYVLAPMWWAHHLWLSIFVAWLAKLLLLRYGGMKLYSAFLPFAFGLILGDCVIGSLWALAASLFHVPTFSVWI